MIQRHHEKPHLQKTPDRDTLSGVVILSVLNVPQHKPLKLPAASSGNALAPGFSCKRYYFFWMKISHIPLSSSFTVSMV